MLSTSKRFEIVFQIIFIFLVLAQPIEGGSAKSRRDEGTKNTTARDEHDLSSTWAKEIIRRSKAADIKSIMNTKVDPCDNFYQYACGNWHRSNPAQLLNNIMTDKFQILAKAFDRRLEKVLEEPGNRNSSLERNVREFYEACQEARNDDVQYMLALENVYKEFGEFPALLNEGEWNSTDFVWWETVARIQHKYGKQIILAIDIMGDIKNNTVNQIYLGSQQYATTIESEVLGVLQKASTARQLQKYLGLSQEVAKKTAKEIIELEHELMKSGTDVRKGVKSEDMFILKNVTDMTKIYSGNWNLRRYLQLVLGTEPPDTLYVWDEKYLNDVFNIIWTHSKSTIANFILWELLQDYLVSSDEKGLHKWCVEKTKKFFGKYIDHMVYKDYKNEKTEAEVYQVWEEIRNTFRDQLQGDKLDWMSNATRQYAIEKLDAMRLEINSYDDENFTSVYGDMDFHRLNYIEIVQQLLMHESRRNINKLNETGSSLESTEVLSFTPAYNLLENTIKIPVALLQPRYFWDDDYPKALKYATLGYLIAHEITHGFDDDGRSHDKHGNQHDWWDTKSTYEFEERRKCFQAQYHKYKYDGKQLPESKSQSENIADNAGIKLAYKAYTRWLERQRATEPDIDKKETLVGLDYDNLQLFFLTFAQVWCDDVQSFFKSSLVSGDVHAPSMYRVIGALSNFQEFSWVFKCKQDAAMDPEFKCSIY